MTRSIKTGALKTLAAAGIAALALAGCGNNAASDAETPTEAPTEAPANEATGNEESPDGAQAGDVYQAAISGLTYEGEPLEVGDTADLVEDWSKPGLSDGAEDYEYSPAECKDLFLKYAKAVDAGEDFASEGVHANGHVGNVDIRAQILPGGATGVNLADLHNMTETCPELDVSDGQEAFVFLFQGFPLDVPGADDTYGGHMVVPLDDPEVPGAYMTTAYATVGDDLVIAATSIRELGNPAELEAILNQIVSALK